MRHIISDKPHNATNVKSDKQHEHQNIINVIFFIIGTLTNVIESVSDVYKSSNFCYDVVVLNMG